MITSSILTVVKEIENYHYSKSSVDRHLRTRIQLVELFLRIVYEGIKGALHVTMLPFVAIKLVLDKISWGRLLPESVSFGEIVGHLKRSSRCATALAVDFPALLIDPSKVRARLIGRKLIDIKTQPKPMTFKSLLKYVWTPRNITLAGVVITAIAFHRLNAFVGEKKDIIDSNSSEKNATFVPPYRLPLLVGAAVISSLFAIKIWLSRPANPPATIKTTLPPPGELSIYLSSNVWPTRAKAWNWDQNAWMGYLTSIRNWLKQPAVCPIEVPSYIKTLNPRSIPNWPTVKEALTPTQWTTQIETIQKWWLEQPADVPEGWACQDSWVKRLDWPCWAADVHFTKEPFYSEKLEYSNWTQLRLLSLNWPNNKKALSWEKNQWDEYFEATKKELEKPIDPPTSIQEIWPNWEELRSLIFTHSMYNKRKSKWPTIREKNKMTFNAWNARLRAITKLNLKRN